MATNALAATNFPTGLPAIVSKEINPHVNPPTFTIGFNDVTTIDYPEYIYVSDDEGNAYTGIGTSTDDGLTHVVALVLFTTGYAPNTMNANALAFSRDSGARTSLELRGIPITQAAPPESSFGMTRRNIRRRGR